MNECFYKIGSGHIRDYWNVLKLTIRSAYILFTVFTITAGKDGELINQFLIKSFGSGTGD